MNGIPRKQFVRGSEGEVHDPPAWRGYLWTVVLVSALTAMGAVWRDRLALPDLVMTYVLIIMVTASLWGRGPSLVAATLSVLTYDFFFIPPFFTLAVDDPRHLITFAIMFTVGLVTSGLTLRIRRHEHDARVREQRTAALYSLSRDLSAAPNAHQAAVVLARHAQDTFHAGAAFVRMADGGLISAGTDGGQVDVDEREVSIMRWVMEHGRRAGYGTDAFPEAEMIAVPVGSGAEPFGTLAIRPYAPRLGLEQWQLLETFTQQAALAIGRAQLAEQAESAALRARTEEIRSALLSTVSHDLRTPLAAITGAGTTLRDMRAAMSESQRDELLDTICEEANRLARLVRNLLDMTRVESGAIDLKREWFPLEEIVGSALTRLDSQLGARPIRTALPVDLPLVFADALLLEQVFVNLLENAVKYTPPETELEISARGDAGRLVVEVADRGPGLAVGTESRVFEKFFRAVQSGPPGAGLGLAICRGIVEAHGGTLHAENREGGGATFRFSLPFVGTPPPELASLESELDFAEPT
jgi:two-component system sensor histidine kinase KdpD